MALCSFRACLTAQKWWDKLCAAALGTTGQRIAITEQVLTPQGTQRSFLAEGGYFVLVAKNTYKTMELCKAKNGFSNFKIGGYHADKRWDPRWDGPGVLK